MSKLLKIYGIVPDLLITEDLRSYGAAAREFDIGKHRTRGRWHNKRAENAHQPLRQRERKAEMSARPAYVRGGAALQAIAFRQSER